MDNTYDAVTKILAVKNIRPSFHRVKVLEYLLTCKDHPAAFAIFDALSPLIPSLSRSTVYNTLNTLLAAGIIKTVVTDPQQVRYDAGQTPHGHFTCLRCGGIYDFDIDHESIKSSGLEGHVISGRDVYYSGVCRICAKK